MKWLVSLFSLYLLLLSVVPCHDTTECAVKRVTVAKQHSHDAETEHCAPLCSCACCGTSIVQQQPLYVAEAITPSFVFRKEIPVYRFFLPQNIHASIWQPPKIV